MSRTMFRTALAAACLAACALPGRAAAQHKLECDSHGGGRTVCETDTRGGVYLHDRDSRAPCVFGRTWGYTRTAVWVSNGCRGDFTVDLPPAVSPPRPLSDADALRVCRNTAAARLDLEEPGEVHVEAGPPDARGSRVVEWSAEGGRSGRCRVSPTAEVTGWTNRSAR
jgi:hypothetical protein